MRCDSQTKQGRIFSKKLILNNKTPVSATKTIHPQQQKQVKTTEQKNKEQNKTTKYKQKKMHDEI